MGEPGSTSLEIQISFNQEPEQEEKVHEGLIFVRITADAVP